MSKPNIFEYSPRELSTDAFLTWMFYYLESDEISSQERRTFLNEVLIRHEDQDKNVESIRVDKQKTSKSGRPDLVLRFKLDDKEQIVLFENKTWTTTSNNQLSKYKNDFPNIYRYIYLKLAYINEREKSLCYNNDYYIINSHQLQEALAPLKAKHPLIGQYIDFLECNFTKVIDGLKEKMNNNDIRMLDNGQGQQMFMDTLYRRFKDYDMNDLYYKTGNSTGGKPWTELDILNCKVKYEGDEIPEALIWRIDKRSKKQYIRLSQYSKRFPKDYLKVKKSRLKTAKIVSREIIEELNNSNIESGKLSKRGKYNREIVIFFMKNNHNHFSELIDFLPEFSKRFRAEFLQRVGTE